MKNIRENIHKFILPAITAVLALMLVLCYLFPNQVLDTYEMNLSGAEDTEEALALTEGSVISYTMNTGKRPLRGIQPAVGVGGVIFENAVLKYRVFKNGRDTVLSENEYRLSDLSQSILAAYQAAPGQDLQTVSVPQFVYLPFEHFETCKGEIRVEFSYESRGDEPQWMAADGGTGNPVPYLIVNTVQKDGTETRQDGNVIAGGLTGYLVYTHNTYPLVYDLRILVFLFLAAAAAVPPARRKKGGKALQDGPLCGQDPAQAPGTEEAQ